MGLDMYGFAEKDGAATRIDDDTYEKTTVQKKIGYWRKHNALHAWFEDLYERQGNSCESFNCVKVYVTPYDLDALETAVLDKDLTPKSGFFFGSVDYDIDDYKEDTLDFIDKARELLKDDWEVYYDSWW